eukprot:CAMPEP_0177728420 /NCGR_PEP_ID=MMETSP0484_2-20121128/20871_1 /TAXON_ID=354590 /ORGANISM="Rhodomonas lens, Strain RHODO" /LENGTH=162 /DNA_ID=CAMNT_0019241191 /DNA_START=23 /DNA_END=511 /DNA_ORIENTATION=-
MAFAPAAGVMPLRTSAVQTQMSMQSDRRAVLSNAAIGFAVAASFVTAPMLPADASVNSQMGMNTDSFSVLKDNSYEYKTKANGRAVNPFASEEDKMAELQRMARIEECQASGRSASDCEFSEKYVQAAAAPTGPKGNSLVSVLAPIVITTGFSGLLIKFLNK